jgi:hypothetical protein
VQPVEGLEDQVAVRVDPRLLLGDPALVDEALHERVVAGDLRQLAAAEQVTPGVADVADRDPMPVEQGDRCRRTGAVEGGVLVDLRRDRLVRLVQPVGDPGEQVGRAGRLVELAQLVDRRARGDVTTGGSADAVADGQQPRAGVAGVLVVLAHATDVGDGVVGEAELLRRFLDEGAALRHRDGLVLGSVDGRPVGRQRLLDGQRAHHREVGRGARGRGRKVGVVRLGGVRGRRLIVRRGLGGRSRLRRLVRELVVV